MIVITEKEIKRVLFGAMVLLGKNGENWTKKVVADKSGKYSAEGAIFESGVRLGFKDEDTLVAYRYACNLVHDLGYSIPSLAMYNDDPKTVFPNIKEVFQVGIDNLKGK